MLARFLPHASLFACRLHALKYRVFNANGESNTLILGTLQNMGVEQSGDTSATVVTVGDQAVGWAFIMGGALENQY